MQEQTLQQENLFDVEDATFEAQVLKSDLPVIVNFWANWCPHCHAIAPTYKKLSAEYKGKLRFARLNSDENELVPMETGVQALPTFLMFNKGQLVARILGPHPSRLKQIIDRALAENGIQ